MENEHASNRLSARNSASHAVPLTARYEESPVARERPVRAEAAEVFLDIAIAVLWSDGPLEAAEVQRARAMANALAVSPPRGGVFGAIADGGLPFSELQFDVFDPVESRQIYALAHWLCTRATHGPLRKAFLDALRIRLGLGEAESARGVAFARHRSANQAPTEREVLDLLREVAAGCLPVHRGELVEMG